MRGGGAMCGNRGGGCPRKLGGEGNMFANGCDGKTVGGAGRALDSCDDSAVGVFSAKSKSFEPEPARAGMPVKNMFR